MFLAMLTEALDPFGQTTGNKITNFGSVHGIKDAPDTIAPSPRLGPDAIGLRCNRRRDRHVRRRADRPNDFIAKAAGPEECNAKRGQADDAHNDERRAKRIRCEE